MININEEEMNMAKKTVVTDELFVEGKDMQENQTEDMLQAPILLEEEEMTEQIQSEELPWGNESNMVEDNIVNSIASESEENQTNNDTVPTPTRRTRRQQILTINRQNETATQLLPEDVSWHELQNASRTRKILTGELSGLEQLENGSYIAVVYYKEFRVVIPINEMMMDLTGDSSNEELAIRQSKIINNMLGSEIDFVVKGIDAKSRSAVASRKEAMLRKRQLFYLTPDNSGTIRITEGSIVEARIIAVTDKVVRTEIFGVECSIPARELTWDWLGNARERFDIGNRLSVKILRIESDGTPEGIRVQASVKEATNNNVRESLKKCRVQGKYAGKVTDVIRGAVYIRLKTGVNAIAHSCNDPRLPGKNDDVSFVVTRLDQERGIAFGIITRIIRQNV